MTMQKDRCILFLKGSSLHSFVYPLASVRVVWLRCGLKRRALLRQCLHIDTKVSPFQSAAETQYMKQEKNIWEQSRVELFQKLDCRETGLSQEDAADRLAKYGANELHAGKQKSVLQIFLGQFADFLVLILILAAVISACMGDVESMIVILAVITMNAILGTVQTVKASASLDSLKQMSAPTAKVLRDGQIVQIPGREVVPGDVVILEAGDSVCADGRLLECASLKCAESALTGESLPVEKDTEPLSGETALGDRKNMVFSGSFVT